MGLLKLVSELRDLVHSGQLASPPPQELQLTIQARIDHEGMSCTLR